jgi:hypothetical protein
MRVTGPRAKRHAYTIPCPTCQAPAGHYCQTRDGELSKYAHASRDREYRPALPDLREWWKSMARFEGQFAQKRPPDLVVP